jgi:uncharacterized membrane protein
MGAKPWSLHIAELSGLATGASWVCYFWALQLGNASKVAPIDKFSLILVAVFTVIFIAERPSMWPRKCENGQALV